MTIQDLKERKLIVFECISGSKAYGLDLPTSDTDIKGVFVIPRNDLFGSKYVAQVANESSDEVYYELGRYFELLKKNNPNILEMLGTPPNKVTYCHPLMESIVPTMFLSRKCKDTFGGFAMAQIKKARGLNKKIVNPVNRERKSVLEFCYVLYQQGAITFKQWALLNKIDQSHCGLTKITHCKDIYGLYLNRSGNFKYKGIIQKHTATSILLSSVPKGESPIGYLYFNKDGYSKYCKDYKAYWDWVANRNESRYLSNIAHAKNYDAKNMMHTFRLLDMAIEILNVGEINVLRPNREELLTIRRGEFEYDVLLERAQQKLIALDLAYQNSALPNHPDVVAIERLLITLRKAFYAQNIGAS